MSPKDFYREGTAPAHMTGKARTRLTRRDFIRERSAPSSESEPRSGSTSKEPEGSSAPPSPSSPKTQESGKTSSSSSEGQSTFSVSGATKDELAAYLIDEMGFTEEELRGKKKDDMTAIIQADQEG